MLLLDTNVVSEARKSACHPNVRAWLAAQPPELLHLSAITVLEIQRGISLTARRGDTQQAALLTRWLDDMVLPAFAGRILAVNQHVARRAGALPWADPNDYRDALIAATAIEYGTAVVTRNVRHFESVGVRLINPWEA